MNEWAGPNGKRMIEHLQRELKEDFRLEVEYEKLVQTLLELSANRFLHLPSLVPGPVNS